MPVTITAGITFSGGGLTMAFAPPPQPTAGWFAGGQNGGGQQSRVSRITYATDTDTGTTRGPLSAVTYDQASTGPFDYGYFAGSSVPGPQYIVSRVQRITYATDTNTASNRGPLDRTASGLAATTTDTYGWFGGGYGSTPGPNSINSLVSRITYATDTATATARGPLSVVVTNLGASGDYTTYGWFGAGYKAGGPISIVSRITYASDTNTASARGPLSAVCYSMGATGNSTNGYFAGGGGLPIGLPGIRSTVDRITYATDTATATTRGPLSITCKNLTASTDNNTYGWWGAGTPGPTQISSVSRITFATDTATASTRGPLSISVQQLSATSGIQ
jgi:hypothetical protein